MKNNKNKMDWGMPARDPWGTPPPNNQWLPSPSESRLLSFRWPKILKLGHIIGIGFISAGAGLRVGIESANQSVWITVVLNVFIIGLILAIYAFTYHRKHIHIGAIFTYRSVAAIATAIIIQLLFSLLGRDLVTTRSQLFSINGAPGYTTITGTHGKPFAIGRPWGVPCKPLVLSANPDIPDWMYAQIVQTASEARADGIDVTIENRKRLWEPSQLYPSNLTNSTVQFIPIYPDYQTPPTLPNGQPEHIQFRYNASFDIGDNHERFSVLQGLLFPKVLAGNPTSVRIATRQLIAFAQGVGGSTARGSGIARGTTVDNFSPRDLSAIQLMSGCQLQPLSGSSTPINT